MTEQLTLEFQIILFFWLSFHKLAFCKIQICYCKMRSNSLNLSCTLPFRSNPSVFACLAIISFIPTSSKWQFAVDTRFLVVFQIAGACGGTGESSESHDTDGPAYDSPPMLRRRPPGRLPLRPHSDILHHQVDKCQVSLTNTIGESQTKKQH